jgi:hypothetical protein
MRPIIVFRRVAARTDTANDLAIHDDRKTAPHLDETCGHRRKPAMVDCLFQRLARLPEQRGLRAFPSASSTLAI